jgi:hypothetical protein
VSRFVLDASAVLTWCFADEKTQKAQEISERIAAGDTVVVPPFWRHEVLNALLVGERRKRITPELVQAFIADLNRLPVAIDQEAAPEIVFHREPLPQTRPHSLRCRLGSLSARHYRRRAKASGDQRRRAGALSLPYRAAGHTEQPAIPSSRPYRAAGHTEQPAIPSSRPYRAAGHTEQPAIPSSRPYRAAGHTEQPATAIKGPWNRCGRKRGMNFFMIASDRVASVNAPLL